MSDVLGVEDLVGNSGVADDLANRDKSIFKRGTKRYIVSFSMLVRILEMISQVALQRLVEQYSFEVEVFDFSG